MKLRAKPLAAGVLAAAAAAWFFYPNPLWPTGWLISALNKENDVHRLIAAGALGGRAGKDPGRVIPALVLALGDRWGEVSGAASAALCAAGEPARPGLRAALRHEDHRIREAAALTLNCIDLGGK